MVSCRQAKLTLKIPERLSRTSGRKLPLALSPQLAFNFGLPFQWLRYGTLSDSTFCVFLRKHKPHRSLISQIQTLLIRRKALLITLTTEFYLLSVTMKTKLQCNFLIVSEKEKNTEYPKKHHTLLATLVAKTLVIFCFWKISVTLSRSRRVH